jgi:hypothetical protein
VLIEILLCGPEGLLSRAEDRAVGQGEHVAGHVLIHSDTPRYQDLVSCPHAHEPLVKGPVAEAAEGQAVRGPVIPALAPWDDVGRLHDGVALRGEDADAAKGTAVIIKDHDGFPKAMVSNHRRLLRLRSPLGLASPTSESRP